MTYETALTALADPTRRSILNKLRRGPSSVAMIARPLPVSRPAVSQHLKVLRKAGLVTVKQQGTRSIYSLSPEGLDPIRSWVDKLWDDAIDVVSAEKKGYKKNQQGAISSNSITKILHVRLGAAESIDLMIADIALWWPVSSHSVSAANGSLPLALTVKPRPGGQFIETLADGTKTVWGTITHWVHPRQIKIDWHVGQPQIDATQIELTFTPEKNGTQIILTHSGWEKFGQAGLSIRAEYDKSWDHVFLDRYSAAAAAALSNFSAAI